MVTVPVVAGSPVIGRITVPRVCRRCGRHGVFVSGSADAMLRVVVLRVHRVSMLRVRVCMVGMVLLRVGVSWKTVLCRRDLSSALSHAPMLHCRVSVHHG